MQQITFHCETITPMFLAGADGTTPELRPPSIKGALRFWWRAMNGHLDLETLKKQEGAIFGDTKQRSKVIVQTIYNKNEFEEKLKANAPGFSSNTTHILNYLSYGTWDKEPKKARGFIDEGFQFDMKLSFQTSLSKTSIESVKKAFEALSAFGNLGMKMRNGFGSFRVLNESIDTKELFETIFANTKDETPPFHAFSKKSAFFKTQKNDYNSWRDALSEIGAIYKNHNNDNIDKSKRIKWGKHEPRHAKSYFLKVNKIDSRYEGQILILPCESPIWNYKDGVKNFKKALSDYTSNT